MQSEDARSWSVVHKKKTNYRSDGRMKLFITSQIYNRIVFSLFLSSLYPVFRDGKINKVRPRVRLFSNGHLFYYFIVNFFTVGTTFSYHIIGDFHPHCRRNTREKDKVYDLLQSARATWQHKNATKNFDYTTVADRLRTVSWNNSSHQTGVVKPVYERSTFSLTATAVQSKGHTFKNL